MTDHNPKFVTLRILRRPWYAWVATVAWLVALGLLLEFALASARELEWQASVLSWITFGLLLGSGVMLNTLQRIDALEEDVIDDDSTR